MLLPVSCSARAVFTSLTTSAISATIVDMMQLGDLGRQDAFNYELQSSQFRDEEALVRHGDVVTTTCVYNSMDRAEVTTGGLGSQEEMCANYMFFYPGDCGMSFLLSVRQTVRDIHVVGVGDSHNVNSLCVRPMPLFLSVRLG